MSGPFELLGDPNAAACEGDLCAVPAPPAAGEQDVAPPADSAPESPDV
jgi:hypothetical protein